MADLMMRMAGRNDEGLAKGIRTDDFGNLAIGKIVNPEPILIASNVATIRNIEKIVLSTITLKDISSVAFGVAAKTGGADIDLVVRDAVGGYVSPSNNLLMARTKFPSANNRQVSKRYNLTSDTIRLAILNHTADTTFDIYMYTFNQPSFDQTQMEFYGLNDDDKPYITYVPVGAMYMALNTQKLFQSNGVEWREV